MSTIWFSIKTLFTLSTNCLTASSLLTNILCLGILSTPVCCVIGKVVSGTGLLFASYPIKLLYHVFSIVPASCVVVNPSLNNWYSLWILFLFSLLFTNDKCNIDSLPVTKLAQLYIAKLLLLNGAINLYPYSWGAAIKFETSCALIDLIPFCGTVSVFCTQ